jgi:hypothetical protein
VTVRTIVVLATVLHELGELEQAERYYREVDAVADPSGRAASLVRVRLALLERDRGDLLAATKRLAAAYGRHRAEFGVGDADTVHIAAQLVELHRAAGDEVAARRVLAEAHTEARAGLGEHHPLTRRLAADMAAVERAAQPVPPALGAPPPAAARSGRLRELWRAGGLRAAALGAVVVGVLMTVTGALALAGGDRDPAALSPPVPAAAPSGPASTEPGLAVASGAVTPIEVSVRLRDDGSTITVSWQLSTPAAVVVGLGAGAGAPLRVVTTVPRGTTSYQLRGLDPRGDYCVTVGPVDASAAVSRTATACTDRS